MEIDRSKLDGGGSGTPRFIGIWALSRQYRLLANKVLSLLYQRVEAEHFVIGEHVANFSANFGKAIGGIVFIRFNFAEMREIHRTPGRWRYRQVAPEVREIGLRHLLIYR